jgi:hypothetical protein
MSVRIVGSTKPGKAAQLGTGALVLFALVTGFLAGLPRGDVSPVYAGTHGRNYDCGVNNSTKTSALYVNHYTGPGYTGGPTVVQPDTGERWSITAHWYPTSGSADYYETAYVTVNWNGSAWATSNVQTASNILGISICQGDTCDAGGGNVHGWDYTIIVDIRDPETATGSAYNLDNVYYVTTSVDGGYTVEDPTGTQPPCYLGTAVSPTSQSFNATDYNAYWGSGRCPFSCTVSGASVTLYYG